MATLAKLPFSTASSAPQSGTVHWLNECVKRGQREVFMEVCTISPGLATQLLSANDHNRSVKSKVQQYADDMRAGRWTFNGEPILIAQTGELNDGQHRLLALIDANVALTFAVMFGLSRVSRLTVDQGAARGASDYLAMDGVENATTAATIARLALAYEASGNQSVDTKPITNAQVCGRTKSDLTIAESATFAVGRGRQAYLYAPATLIGFCHNVFSKIDNAAADDYLMQVCSGENLKAGCPAIAVRERLLAVGKSRQAKVAVLFRGWNFYRRNMRVKANSVQATMPLPALI